MASVYPDLFAHDGVNVSTSLEVRFGGAGIRRGGRIRVAASIFGCKPSNKKVVDVAEDVRKAAIPNGLADIVVRSDALVGDLWRLACEAVKREKTDFRFTKLEYEQFYEIAKRYCKEVNDNSMMSILKHYRTLCSREFGLEEIQERRLEFRTPSKRLIADLKCFVNPPVWEKPKVRKKRGVFFSCSKNPPDVDQDITGEEICVICGFEILPAERDIYHQLHYEKANCRKCRRPAHVDCATGLFFSKKSFLCNKIPR